MRPRSLVLLTILLGFASPHSARASNPVQVIQPDTTYDEPPRPLEQVHPPWRGKDEGFVQLWVRVDTTGHVTEASPMDSFSEEPIGPAAVEAARQWTFTPARKRGKAVDVRWAIEVELRHPRSAELVAARDTLSVVPTTGSRERSDLGAASLHVSVTYDSVTANYRYSYFLRNRSAGEARVIAFALLGTTDQVSTAPDPRFTSWQPPEWQGNWTLQTECGERRDALVWMIWNADPRTGSQFDFALTPDRLFEPAVLRSRFPPSRVRWAVQTATGPDSESALVPCRPGAKTRWETLPLTGTTVGPVAK